MLDHPYLLGNDVELFADLGADLDQHAAVMRANALGFGQLVTHDVPWQRGIEWFAAASLFAPMARHFNTGLIFFCRLGRRRRRQGLRLVKEQILLPGTARFAACRIQLVQIRLHALLEQVPLDRHDPQLATQCDALFLHFEQRVTILRCLTQRFQFIDSDQDVLHELFDNARPPWFTPCDDNDAQDGRAWLPGRSHRAAIATARR